MSAEPLVRTAELEAVFTNGDGVGPVTLDIAAGEQVLVLGPSGSGKSSVLRMLHGVIPHAMPAHVSGKAWIDGRDVGASGVADLADVVGVVRQDPEAGVCLAQVSDEVAFPLENLAWPRERIGPAMDRALRRAGAENLRDRSTTELSGGELQRVALAAAIAAEPRLLLLDEPTAMLDADGIASVRDALDAARRETGAASVLVEHRLDEIAGERGLAALPSRWVVVGRDGRIVSDSPAAELTTDDLRRLVGQGCWLPLDLELAALLDGDGGPAPDSTTPRPERIRPQIDRHADGDGVSARLATDSFHGALGAALERSLDALRAEGAQPVPSTPASGGQPIAPARLSASGLAVARGARARRREVLTDVDLELRTGEVVALVGANGTGKSSLLACLAGLERPAAGRVDGPRPGLVFQNPEHQFAAGTVAEEVAFGSSGQESSLRAAALLERFDLTELAGHAPHRLSGGQQRRVSLAAMLVHDRPFLLADEPTFGLDRHAHVAAMRALRDAAAQGRGVLFSSHDLRAVLAYADRVIVLGGGAVLAQSTPAELVRDDALLVRAHLRPPRLVRWLSDRFGADAVPIAAVLRALDRRALALRPGLVPA